MDTAFRRCCVGALTGRWFGTHLLRVQYGTLDAGNAFLYQDIVVVCLSSGRGALVTWFARLGDSDYEEDENGVRFHTRPRPSYLAPTLNQSERVSAPTLIDKTLNGQKRSSIVGWGAAAAGAVCIGIALLSYLPGGGRQSSTGEEKARVTADATRASGEGRRLGPIASEPPRDLDGGSGLDPAEQGTRGDIPAASDALGRPVRRASDVGKPAARGDPVATRHASTSPRDTSPAAKEPLSAPVKTAGARPKAEASALARVPGGSATAPRPAAPAILGTTAGARLARTPARWIGGGPTDADNRRGRYQGTVGVQVTVNPAGHVSRCAPVRRSGNAGTRCDDMPPRAATGAVHPGVRWARPPHC